jgi:hypothetical protein
MNRKQRRTIEAKRQKGDSKQAMEDKLMMFGHLPDSCSACEKSFDKTSRDMVFSTQEVLNGTTKNQ